MDKFKQVITITGMVITLVSALLPVVDQSIDMVNKVKCLKEGAK